METRWDELERRVTQAERRLAAERRVRLLFGVMLALGAITLGAAKPALTEGTGSTVKAPFKIVDDEGKTMLKVESEGRVSRLTILNKDGDMNILLGTSDSGGAFFLDNSAGKTNVGLMSTKHGGGLVINNPEGKPAGSIMSTDGGGAIGIWGKAAQPAGMFAAGTEGGSIFLDDADGNTVFSKP